MRRQSFPLWLLRDVPAFMGFIVSFWALIIFAMASGGRVMRADKAGKRAHDQLALMLAYAEARFDHALWRQAYRRLGWHPRLAPFHLIAPTMHWADTQERIALYNRAFRNMNLVVDAYVDDLRQRYRISQREVASATTHAPVRTPLATLTKSSLAARRWGQRAALTRATSSSRDGGGCVRVRARGPPLASIFKKPAPPHLAGPTCENAPACPQ